METSWLTERRPARHIVGRKQRVLKNDQTFTFLIALAAHAKTRNLWKVFVYTGSWLAVSGS